MRKRTVIMRRVGERQFDRVILAIPMNGYRLVIHEGEDDSFHSSQTIAEEHLESWIKYQVGWEVIFPVPVAELKL
jgi:hypothetical protein